jgi:hypothetical protein
MVVDIDDHTCPCMEIPGWPPKNIESLARCFEDGDESLDQAERDQGEGLRQSAPLVRRI